ncbi:MAG TPA: hypothetical protein VFV67_18955 [Actinophytocola sp.]|uniref:hypothetical protein n=1 Tax=Actinophytocola sp. TaxID=1872138 RepID=UPI002DB7C963|nr:hypothetical protein [Actinophytocola sp.]HEU5472732.1 hypothetical protein [Actinophytocola sp.]
MQATLTTGTLASKDSRVLEERVSKEKRTPKGGHRVGREWGVVVRLTNGSTAYYCRDVSRRTRDGNQLESWGRLTQAHRFPSEQEAHRAAAAMPTNAMAKEYTVVQLPVNQPTT